MSNADIREVVALVLEAASYAKTFAQLSDNVIRDYYINQEALSWACWEAISSCIEKKRLERILAEAHKIIEEQIAKEDYEEKIEMWSDY